MLKHLSLLFFGFSVFAKTYYTSPTGKSTNTGSSFNSAFDLSTSLSKVTAGDTILLQGGTYTIAYVAETKNTITISKSGTGAKNIYIMAQSGASKATLDFSFPDNTYVQDSYGLDITGSYWYFKNINITRAGYQGAYVKGSYNTFENCAFYKNRNSGLEINKGGAYTTVINCDAYENYDPKKQGSMADGFASKQTQGAGNTFTGCRAWNNSDDGWDTFDSDQKVIIRNSWAFSNGVDIWNYGGFTGNGNGFKVGGNYKVENNELYNCVAFGNPSKGFDQNNNYGGVIVYNCTSYNNGINYGFGGTLSSGEKHTFKNNISLGANADIANATQSNNTWNSGFTVSSSDFQSLDLSLAKASRNADGSIPTTTLFRLKSTSKLIDAGVNVGLPYNGSKPDLGAFETGSVVTSLDETSAGSLFEEENTFTVFPNPSMESFTLKTAQNSQFQVYNDQGILVENITSNSVFGSEYTKGVYLLKESNSGKTLKIVKD
ncbi:MAG: right-handed parallel beta-helix repeat-containing protein [Cytophagales bacterium]